VRRTVLPILALLLAGCGVGGGIAVRREVVVTFAADAPESAHEAALRACAGLPRTSPEPRPTSTREFSRRNDVRFRVDRAGDADLARLYECLQRQPGVVGVGVPG
jgi:hypothetical protein